MRFRPWVIAALLGGVWSCGEPILHDFDVVAVPEPVARVPECGDGIVDTGEECDDGNKSNDDACPDGVAGTCIPAACGDGFIQIGIESCDDGNKVNTDACPDGTGGTCQAASCGDGFIQTSVETCDDGVNNSDTVADACRSTCVAASCGDLVTDSGEVCDDGAQSATCDPDCTAVDCGDGYTNTAAGEGCDDQNLIDNDACSNACEARNPTCGDGILDAGEDCDVGGETAQCDANCTTRVCGDGYANSVAGEQCDDGNTVNTDGCLTSCLNPSCGDGHVWAGQEACDDSNTSSEGEGSCVADCSAIQACGNGAQEGTETCDDSGESATCDDDCTAVSCGDGNINENAGEACENPMSSCESMGMTLCIDTADCTWKESWDEDGNIIAVECVLSAGSEGSCLPGCSGVQTCGNGAIEGTETCDDSGESASCDDDCTAVSCGDGNINESAGEACERPSANCVELGVFECIELNECRWETEEGARCLWTGGEGICLAGCSGVQTCGNGVIEGTEVCDDGNTTEDGNGCSSSCLCLSGYAGAECIYSDATTCSGWGAVDDAGVCTCIDGWMGTACESPAVVQIGGLTWKKCVQGMTYNAATGACDGSESEFQYCDQNDNSCNGGVSGGLLDGNGNSEAWDTCHDLVYAGYDDWRVPNTEEQASLVECNDGPLDYPNRVDCGIGNFTLPNIDTALFPDFPSASFWTSASYAADSLTAWGVLFAGGYVGYGDTKDIPYSVLCVRALCGNGVIDNGETCDDGNRTKDDACPDGFGGTCQAATCGDGFIRDGVEACDDGNTIDDGNGCTATCTCAAGFGGPSCAEAFVQIGGLTWKKCAQGMTYDSVNEACTGSYGTFEYCDANDNSCNGGVSGGLLDGGGNSPAWDTCNDLVYAGYDDWRVPNKEELASLVQCNDGPLNYPNRTSCGGGNYTSPVIDTGVFPNFPSTSFWTSASRASNSNDASDVFFSIGYVGNITKDSTKSVLCVR